MKKSAQKRSTFLIILVSAAFIIGILLNLAGSQKKNTTGLSSPPPTTTKFQSSSALKFSIDVPTSLNVVDGNGFVEISSGDGKLLIIRNGSFFNDINSYLADLETKNRFSLSSKAAVPITNTETVAGFIGSEKSYFIMPNGSYAVYVISTSSPQLYPVLDQIAKSFRYTP